MEYYNGILCISGKELIISDDNPNGLIPYTTYRNWVIRKRITIVRRGGGEGTPALIEFASLPEKYRRLAKDRGLDDPEVEAAKQGIVKYLERDPEAIKYFRDYRIGYEENEKGLPDDIQQLYSNNAAILNAIKKQWDEHVINISSRNKRPLAGIFWSLRAKAIQNMPKEWRCDLPKTDKRLRLKLKNYMEYGYCDLLSGKWGNQNTRIITEEVGDWLVAKWSALVPEVVVSVEHLLSLYNKKVEEVNNEAGHSIWKKIKSSVAIREYLYRPDIEESWYAARHGELEYKEKYLRQHRTNMASLRDSLWYSDGTKLNFYYQDENGKTRTIKVYEVFDAYSEVFLGCHISQEEDFEAQFFAYKKAIQFSGHKPYELRYDNQGGHKKLETGGFLASLTRHAIRTAPYNGKSKTIENAFGRFQAFLLKRKWYFTGMNVTTKKKESRPNMEFILANPKKRPSLEEITAAYMEYREEWNNLPHPVTGIPRIEMYRTSANDKAQPVDFLDMITMFGITTKDPSTYRSSGIVIEVKKKKYEYEVLGADGMPDSDFMRRNIGRRFYVRYDLDNMDIVALYEKDASGMRFITLAQPYIKVQRNLQEQTNDDKVFIRRMEITNKLQRIDNAKQTNERLERYDLHPNQHGLNVPKIKGLNMRKKNPDIGEIQKEVSNMTELEEKEKATRRAVKKAEKEIQKQEAEDRDDFYKDRIKLLEATLDY